MKKLIYSLLLFLFVGQMASAQDLNYWVSSLALVDKADYQQIDRQILDLASFQTELTSDSTASKPVAPFLKKLDSIDIINLTPCSDEVKVLFLKDFENLEDANGYQTLINENDGTDRVRIIAKKDGSIISQVFVFAIAEGDGEIFVFRMNGRMDESDIADIIKQTPI